MTAFIILQIAYQVLRKDKNNTRDRKDHAIFYKYNFAFPYNGINLCITRRLVCFLREFSDAILEGRNPANLVICSGCVRLENPAVTY